MRRRPAVVYASVFDAQPDGMHQRFQRPHRRLQDVRTVRRHKTDVGFRQFRDGRTGPIDVGVLAGSRDSVKTTFT